jgi:Cys-tRNA(Pro)/Cys-tRNA(Cys) deacylase
MGANVLKTAAMRMLEDLRVAYAVKKHSKKAFTAVDAAKERDVRLEQIVKAMIVEKHGGGYLLALIPGHKELSLKKLARFLGIKNVRLATPGEVHSITGYRVGAVSAVGLRTSLEAYMDETVMSEELVDISAGRHDAGLELRSEDLLSATNATLGDFVK